MHGRFLKAAGLHDITGQAFAINFSAGTPLYQDFLGNRRISFHLMQPFLVKRAIALYPGARKQCVLLTAVRLVVIDTCPANEQPELLAI